MELCYEQCEHSEANGVGPVCWGGCPEGYHDCGMLCAEDGLSCFNYYRHDTQDFAKMVLDGKLTQTGEKNPLHVSAGKEAIDVGRVMGDYVFPPCHEW